MRLNVCTMCAIITFASPNYCYYSVTPFIRSFIRSFFRFVIIIVNVDFCRTIAKCFILALVSFLLPFSLYRAFIHLFWVFDSEWASVCHWTCQPYKSFEENVDAHYAKTEYIEWFTEWIIWWGMRWNCSLAYGILGTGNDPYDKVTER